MLEKDAFGYRETLFILPPNLIEERWTGARMKPEEIEAASMISNFAYRDTFEEELKKCWHPGELKSLPGYRSDGRTGRSQRSRQHGDILETGISKSSD